MNLSYALMNSICGKKITFFGMKKLMKTYRKKLLKAKQESCRMMILFSTIVLCLKKMTRAKSTHMTCVVTF